MSLQVGSVMESLQEIHPVLLIQVAHIFNAVVSGSLFGGIPSNKVTALAGESSTGKTFFALSVVRNFLDNNSDGGVIYFESESALSKDLIESEELILNVW